MVRWRVSLNFAFGPKLRITLQPSRGLTGRPAVDGGRARDERRTRKPARRIAARMAKSRRCRPLDDGSTNGFILLLQAAHVGEAEGQDMLAWAMGQLMLPI